LDEFDQLGDVDSSIDDSLFHAARQPLPETPAHRQNDYILDLPNEFTTPTRVPKYSIQDMERERVKYEEELVNLKERYECVSQDKDKAIQRLVRLVGSVWMV
jgi:hypothetical protein